VWAPAGTLHGTLNDWESVPVLDTVTVPSLVGVEAMLTIRVVDGANAEPDTVTVRPLPPHRALRATRLDRHPERVRADG
jgi:hypothetical protein